MTIDLSLLFNKQKELDEEIHLRHHVSYPLTLEKRAIALLVELGEFANALRCFKFWSNKPSESKERILDEYADALHFILSLGIGYNFKNYNMDYETNVSNDINTQILLTYQAVVDFSKSKSEKNYRFAFKNFLNILPLINSNLEEMKEAYFKKLEVNLRKNER